jgi:hypothetical protein
LAENWTKEVIPGLAYTVTNGEFYEGSDGEYSSFKRNVTPKYNIAK